MENQKCLECGCELEKIGNEYICKSCEAKYIKKAYCPDCGSGLEKLAACGSLSYWCNKCNELKSRKAIIQKLTKDA
ncbi:MAG: zinc ribbon domain-containing protein [Cetobacterium sp.]